MGEQQYLSVFIFQVPIMCKYQVHEERNGDDDEWCGDEQMVKTAEIGIAGE